MLVRRRGHHDGLECRTSALTTLTLYRNQKFIATDDNRGGPGATIRARWAVPPTIGMTHFRQVAPPRSPDVQGHRHRPQHRLLAGGGFLSADHSLGAGELLARSCVRLFVCCVCFCCLVVFVFFGVVW